MEVDDTGGPLMAPVGKGVLSRMLDVFGNVIDREAPLTDVQWRSVHRAPPALSRRSTRSEVFETGITLIDVLLPLERGGKAGLFGGAGVARGGAGGRALRRHFGLVIGVDRLAHAQALREAGAHVVVTDLAQIHVAVESRSAWSLVFDDFDPAQEGIREALCTLGNGYFATRGAAPGAVADEVHYPGTYLAGGYDRLSTVMAPSAGEHRGAQRSPPLRR